MKTMAFSLFKPPKKKATVYPSPYIKIVESESKNPLSRSLLEQIFKVSLGPIRVFAEAEFMERASEALALGHLLAAPAHAFKTVGPYDFQGSLARP
jgi:hypothetical protein